MSNELRNRTDNKYCGADMRETNATKEQKEQLDLMRAKAQMNIKPTMDDLISRQISVLTLLEKGQKSRRYKLGEIWELNFDEIREALETVPSVDAVEVVRCKDCKYWNTELTKVFMCYCPMEDRWTGDDYYCASGERKTDG